MFADTRTDQNRKSASAAMLLIAGGLLTLAAAAAVYVSSPGEHMAMLTTAGTLVGSVFLGRQRSGGGGERDEAAEPAPAGATPNPEPPSGLPRAAHATPPPQPDPADARREDERWFETLLEFTQETLGALQGDRLSQLIAQKLPVLVGRENVWVVASPGSHQHVILPQRASRDLRMLSDEPRQWATFPLKADGHTVGVLGIEVGNRGITAREWRMLTALAGVLGRALKTSEAFEAMREATLVDPLTGCATRAEGLRRFEAELRRAERSKTSVAVLMIDLDHFKSINDRFGHNTGDAVLSAVGETLLGTLRASDIRSRWGGEEFLVVLPESTIERASSAAESLRQRIAATSVRDGDNTVRVTTSIGITLVRPGEIDIPRLLGRADTALYQAKSEGRNRVMIAVGDQKAPMPIAGPSPGDPPSGTIPAHLRDRRHTGLTDRRSGMGRRRTDLVAGG
jgi:diguanylate cyclase (GGDEF)-like protein